MIRRALFVSKVAVQRLASTAGYRFEKLHETVHPIDVFDLAVRKAAAERGADFYFVQIGANDGMAYDPIQKYVREFGWRGLLIEPLPNVFAELKRNYADQPQLKFLNAAVAREEGTAVLYTVPPEANGRAADHVDGLTSFSRQQVETHVPRGTPIQALEVPAMRLENALARFGVSQIDLLQIDVEGFDFEVVKMVDFERRRPSVIHYEYAHLSRGDRTACEKHLAAHGYRLYSRGGDTTAVLQS